MESQIKQNLQNPEFLERSYRSDKSGFIEAFNNIYPEIKNSTIAEFWHVRLELSRTTNRLNLQDLIYMIIPCLLLGLLVRIPQVFGFDPDSSFFFQKNAALFVFAGVSIYRILSDRIHNIGKVLAIVTLCMILSLYINFLPIENISDAVTLSLVHFPFLLWGIYGLIFTRFEFTNLSMRFQYIRYNGDLVVVGVLIAIAGGILTGITIGLFSTIGINIEEFYFENIVVWGIVALPVVGSYILKNYPSLTSKVTSVIAQLFSPLVLLTLVVFLVFIPIAGQNPYSDRNFLFVFNLMLIGVMLVITFSVAENAASDSLRKFNSFIIMLLTAFALIIDIIALSAIIYRLGEFGLSPNRLAVLISNVLILGHLGWILADLIKVNFRGRPNQLIQNTIARYVPIYLVWVAFVVLFFPLIFKF